MGRCHSMELDLAWHDSHDWCWKTKSDPSRDQCDISHSLMFERGKDPSRVAARFVSFLFDESKSPFGQEVDGWDTDCPSWMPGGRSHTKSFCRKIPPPKRTWFPPENPEPRGQTAPTATSAPSAPSAPGASAPVHRTHVEKPQLAWELPAATVRQEQKLVVEEPEVPFTAPEVRPAPQISSTKRMQKKIEKHEEMGPQFQSPDEIQDVADVAPPPKPPPHVEVDPGKPRPPLIVEQKTSKPSKSPEIGIVEEEVSPEEQMFDADPEARKLLDKLSEENIALEEKKVQEVVPKNPPGTPKMEDQEPFWPPHGAAPQMQPIPPRPGEPNYNYGWTPPEGQVPYSPPWPGGAPLTAVDRVEAVAEELGNEANAAVHVAEDALLNTTM